MKTMKECQDEMFKIAQELRAKTKKPVSLTAVAFRIELVANAMLQLKNERT